MKYYSEVLHRIFDTEEALNSAENEERQKTIKAEAEAKAREKIKNVLEAEIEAAREAAKESVNKYLKSIEAYTHKFGSYTPKSDDEISFWADILWGMF